MSVYVSTTCLAGGSNILDVLRTYAKAGLRYVELGASHKYIGGLSLTEFQQWGFNFIVHHYFPPPKKPLILNLASQNATILAQSKEQIKRSIDFCHSVGVRLFSLHAGFRADPNDKLRFSHDQAVSLYGIAFNTFVESVREINSYAQEKGVRIAIENNVLSEYNVINGQNRFLLFCEAEEFERLLERTPSINVGIVLDLGHLKISSHWLCFDKYGFIEKVKDRVFAIHVHENNGRADQHREMDETSWCFEVIGRKCFSNLPIVLESTGLTIDKIIQQVSLVEEILR